MKARELPIDVADEYVPLVQELWSHADAWKASEEGTAFLQAVWRSWQEIFARSVAAIVSEVAAKTRVELVETPHSLPRFCMEIERGTPRFADPNASPEDPDRGFRPTHPLLFYCFHLHCEDPLQEANAYYLESLRDYQVGHAAMKAILTDPLARGLAFYAEGGIARTPGYDLIVSALRSVWWRMLGPEISDELREELDDVVHDYLIEQLPKLQGLSTTEILAAGFKNTIAGRHGIRCDVKNLLDKRKRRDRRLRRMNDSIEEAEGIDAPAIGSVTSPEWFQKLRGLDFLSIGAALDKHDRPLRAILGPKWAAVVRVYLERPDVTQEVVAHEVGCSVSTVQVVLRAIRENEHLVRHLLGFPTRKM